MDQLTETELKPYNEKTPDAPGLDDYQRKWLQIGMETKNDGILSRFREHLYGNVYLDVDGLRQEMATWKYPLHMIDFETTAVALPYYIGMKPYEQVAFQFSHHIIYEDGRIEHAGQYLNEDVTKFPGHFLLGWSEDKDATEPTYEADTEINIGELEKTKTLYAIWTADGVTRYHVKHYQQAYDLSGYSLTETERLYGQAGAEVTPDVKTYEGFAQPSTKTVTLAADGSTEVEYKYDRLQYRIHFDGNTATAGSMSDMRMLMGVGSQLRSNAFRKTGAIFTGWNTAADGSGTTYTDKANVVDLTNEHGSTVTLYAQWLENTNPAVTPTNGAVRVTLKQGQKP